MVIDRLESFEVEAASNVKLLHYEYVHGSDVDVWYRGVSVDTHCSGSYHPDMGLTSESYRYIVRSADIRSGNPIVEGTRIGVHDVIGLLQNGETIDTLRENCFPNLSKSQIYECLAYYEDHRGQIDLLVARQTSLGTK